MLLVVIRIHLCMPFSPTTSSKPQIPSYDTTPSESQCLHDTNAFADPRSPTETPLAPAWAATRCAHGTPVVPNQCLKSSSSLGGKLFDRALATIVQLAWLSSNSLTNSEAVLSSLASEVNSLPCQADLEQAAMSKCLVKGILSPICLKASSTSSSKPSFN
ncbi:hypothetical protein ACKVV7_009470 [Pyricularia oryzae]